VAKQTTGDGLTGFQKNEEAPQSQQANGCASKQIKANDTRSQPVSSNINRRQIPQRKTQGHIGNTAVDQTKTRSDKQMTTMIISNMHPRGFAFGITEDGEQVFIPPFLAKGAGVQTGDTVKAQVTINPQQSQRQSTPYIAVKIESNDDSKADEIELSKEELRSKTDSDVYDAICVGSYISTSELAKDLGIDSKTVGNSALRLYNAGKIAKADVYNRVGQSRSSMTLWAESADDFLET
jgi:hypothetical protein